jgi:peptidoglycan/LPS O-acetylase OafA/YrhL
MSTPLGPGLSYRPDIDGLRAIAIVLVVLGHAGLIFRGGFLGVDIFFVISGFLITSLLRKEIASGSFSLTRFWVRRVHRLLPALTVASLGTVTLSCLLMLPEDLAELGRSLMAQSLLLANVFFWQTSGYFDGAASQKPLLHYWSLAVEEQFYLFFPLLMMLKPGRKMLAGLALGSLTLTLLTNQQHPSACFYLLPFRAWELLLGGLLALSEREVPARWRAGTAWVGLLAIALAALQIHEKKVIWPGWATLIPCLATALLIASCRQPDHAVARFLSHPRMVWLGLISYSWYLWHWSMIALWNSWKLSRTPVLVRLLWVGLGCLLGYLSYRYIETPCRRPRADRSAARVLGLAAGVQLLLFGVGWLLAYSQGWPGRLPEPLLRLADRGTPPWAHYQVSLDQARQGQLPILGQDGPLRLVLWGDSHAMALIPELEKQALRARCRVLVATHSGAVPLIGYPSPDVCSLGPDMEAWNQAVLERIKEHEPAPGVLLAARWSYQPRPELAREALERTVDALGGHRVWLLQEVPVYPYDPRKALLRAAWWGESGAALGLTRQQYTQQNAGLASWSVGLLERGLVTLDPGDFFFATGERASLSRDGLSCYWDDNHLSPQGASLLAPLLAPLLLEQTNSG